MEFLLRDEEFMRIQKYRTRLAAIHNQVENLMAQGDDIKDIVNTCFRDASRRAQLEDKLGDDSVPPMINAMGQEVVRINAKTRTAQWETHHDAKRIAKEAESDDEKCDESTKEEE